MGCCSTVSSVEPSDIGTLPGQAFQCKKMDKGKYIYIYIEMVFPGPLIEKELAGNSRSSSSSNDNEYDFVVCGRLLISFRREAEVVVLYIPGWLFHSVQVFALLPMMIRVVRIRPE